MNAQINATEFRQFQNQVYQNFTKRDDSAMELLDAMCSMPNTRSVVELSLSPHFNHQYPSLYKLDFGQLKGSLDKDALFSVFILFRPFSDSTHLKCTHMITIKAGTDLDDQALLESAYVLDATKLKETTRLLPVKLV